MLLMKQILVCSLALVASAVMLAGCGQTGDLYLPTGSAAAERATLVQSLLPDSSPAPGHAASAPQKP